MCTVSFFMRLVYGFPVKTSPITNPAIRKTANNEIARKNKIRAAAAAPTAIPVNPIAPATIETMKNINAQRNIIALLSQVFHFLAAYSSFDTSATAR